MVRTRKSAILGPDGKQVEVSLLSEEIAAPTPYGVRAIPLDAVASGLTPERLAGLLREATYGQARAYLTLATEMEERYLHYASQLQTRKLAFDAIDETVEAPKGVPTKIVDAVHALLEGPSFREACMDLTDGLSKGYAVVEPIWEYQGGYLQPVAYEDRDQRFFEFDPVKLRELRLIQDGLREGEPLTGGKFITHMPRTRTGLPIRRGIARPAAWAFLVQSFALQDWAAFCEIYGVPFRLGKYHSGASENDKRTLLRAVRDIANDAAAIVPEGMSIEFHEVNGSRGEAVFGGLLGYIDRQISKLVVGQTMTADDGASLGQAKIHNEVRLDILRADCRQMKATINRDLIRWFVAMNFGPQDVYPIVDFPVAEPEDVLALTQALERTVPLGLKVSQRQVREKLGLSEPEKEDDLLAPPRPAAAPTAPGQVDDDDDPPPQPAPKKPAKLALHVRGCRCEDCQPEQLAAASGDDRDDVDELLDETLRDWQAITDPLLEELFAVAAESNSYEEVLAKLDSLRLNSEPLRERLAVATTIARGLGDVKD